MEERFVNDGNMSHVVYIISFLEILFRKVQSDVKLLQLIRTQADEKTNMVNNML